jgi:hypothetical protein
VTSALQCHGSAPPSLTRLAPIQSSLPALFLEVVTLKNQNLFASVFSPFLTQLKDAHDLITAMTIAANVKFQDPTSPDGINPSQRNVAVFNLTI